MSKPSLSEMTKRLNDAGYSTGPRDPERNIDFPGGWMVAEELPADVAKPTHDASDGAYCIVGDDLSTLIEQAYDHNFNW